MRGPNASAPPMPLRSGLARVLGLLSDGPEYPPEPADRRTVSVLGLRLPVRSTVVLFFVVTALLVDYRRDLIPAGLHFQSAPGMRAQAIERLVMFGAVPLVALVAVLRDDPRRYGLRLGDWRVGLSVAALGCAVMAPIIVILAGVPAFREFYTESSAPVPELLVTNALDLFSSEFFYRGFLMFALLRAIGPLGVVVAAVPFACSHLGKPDLETFSTFFGGLAFGWLNWRTGSILYSAIAHVFILTLVIAAAGRG